jgi:hypothetical protein
MKMVNSSPPNGQAMAAGTRRPRFDIHHRAQAVGDHQQQLIAAGMTKAVIDALEAIQVDEQHRRLLPPRRQRSVCRLRRGSGGGWEARYGSNMPSAWALSIELRTKNSGEQYRSTGGRKLGRDFADDRRRECVKVPTLLNGTQQIAAALQVHARWR